jgi:serine/threonine protein phosphatase PrpC
MSPQLRVGGRSDVGLHRHNNQDSMYAGTHLIAVADGVGGAAGGEVASWVTITALASLDSEAVADPQPALRSAAEQADTSIRETVARNPDLAGMSTTLTAILATDGELTLAHIGDSRAYLLRNGELSQLTHDHTLVQSLIDDGQITESEALTHPRRSWILRALDGRGQPDLDLVTLDVQPGDRYLVCSDGLSSYVSEADITAGLAGDDPQSAAERLTQLALQAGGPDNISCAVADPVDDDLGHQQPILGGAVAEPPPPAVTAGGPAAPSQPLPPPTTDTAPEDVGRVRQRSIGKRLAAVAALVVILVAAGVAGVAVYIHKQWYIAPNGGQVSVYQGVQGNAAGIHLSHLHMRTNLPVTALPQDDRDRVANGIQASGGQSGAGDVVANLRHEACALLTPTPSPTPTATKTSAAKRATKAAVPPAPPVWCANTS